MVKLGFNKVSIYPFNGIMIENNGTMIFNGRCSIGNDSYISIGFKGVVEFGDNFVATASLKLASHDGIYFGSQVSVGWNCMFIDSDFHRLTRTDGRLVKGIGKIYVGDNVWFGNTCIVQKNTKIPSYTTIAAGTLLNKPLSIPEKTLVGNRRSIDVLKIGVWRNFEDDNILL